MTHLMKLALMTLLTLSLALSTAVSADPNKVKKKDVEKIVDVIEGDCELFDDKGECKSKKKGKADNDSLDVNKGDLKKIENKSDDDKGKGKGKGKG